MAPRLELSGITKRYPGVVANDDVSLAVAPGEIHAILGENGAGKSTLVKILYGVQRADQGLVRIDGHEVAITSPRVARALGIAMVFQHFSLFEAMTVLENIALGLDGKLSGAALGARVREVLQRYGLALDPHRPVHTLSVSERQRIEIVRALLGNPRILVMDEPTSVLTPQEAEQLFATVRQIAAEGCTVLYISHKLEEIRQLCSSATILRQGKVVASVDPRLETARSMAETMIGGHLRDVKRRGWRSLGKPRLEVASLCAPGEPPFGVSLHAIDLTVRAGEIFGIAGVAGNGQSELFAAITGERRTTVNGSVRIDGAETLGLDVAGRRELGLASVPEERNGHGAVPAMTLTDNAVLSARGRANLSGHGLVRVGPARRFAARVIELFSVRARGPEATAASLSGGNLQKFVVGREITQEPTVLVASQPTWGVDAGAASAIRQSMADLAEAGAAILVISQDLDELLQICDRIAVLNDGRLSTALETSTVSVEEIGLLMGGIHGAEEARVPDAA